MFGALSTIGLALPWFSSLTDPQAQLVRDAQRDEKLHRDRADDAERRGQHDEAQRERKLERECHNRAIQTLMQMTHQKLTDCERHGWRDAALKHHNELMSLEQQIWADPDVPVVSNPNSYYQATNQSYQQQGPPVTLNQFNPIQQSQSQPIPTQTALQSDQPPPSYAESMGQ